MKLYVGNLSYSTTQDSLREAFGAIGAVDEGGDHHGSRDGPAAQDLRSSR